VAEIGRIEVRGLREFNRVLRRIDRDAPKGLRLAGNKAAQLVVDTAQPRVPTGPGRGGHAKSSIKAASTRTAARIRAGGKRYPYYPWLDFGGRVGRNRSVRRPFLKEGRYIWKSYADERARVEGILRDELTDLARSSGAGVRVR
jgi:hypothetical protein